MNQQVTCPNCGAGFSGEEPRCPYCGAINPSGAESAYMHKLESLRDETDKLDDDVQRNLEVDFGQNSKRIIKVVAIVVVVLIAVFFAVKAVSGIAEQRELHDYKVREAFREQYFDEFNRLYESGDDAALSTLAWSLTDDPGFEAIFTWKHIEYLEAYNDWEALKSTEVEIQEGSLDLEDYTWVVSVAIRLGYPDAVPSHQSYALTKEEEMRAAPFRQYAREFLKNTLQMNEEETLSFIDKCIDKQDGILDAELERNLKQRLSEIGTL